MAPPSELCLLEIVVFIRCYRVNLCLTEQRGLNQFTANMIRRHNDRIYCPTVSAEVNLRQCEYINEILRCIYLSMRIQVSSCVR